jgi:hypothetical protein
MRPYSYIGYEAERALVKLGNGDIIHVMFNKKMNSALFVFLAGVFVLFPVFSEEGEDNIASFSSAERVWGNGAERYIEEAFRLCFTTTIIAGKVINIRMPFAENHERDQLVEGGWEFVGKGKASPEALWPVINEILVRKDFEDYVKALSDGKEKVIILDISKQSWTVSEDFFDITRMKAGAYHGQPHKPYVLVNGQGVRSSDVYNYLYCIAWAGMDCSGFVWHCLSYMAKQKGKDLGELLRGALGTGRGANPSEYAGTWFFGSKNRELEQVKDEIASLKAGDIILFRADSSGAIAHSAIIQSVDDEGGVVRYFQSTDEAPIAERGVHESFIYFNPQKPNVSLLDESLIWSQQRYAPFPGEKDSAFSDDGARFRAFGGGKVVRLRSVAVILR